VIVSGWKSLPNAGDEVLQGKEDDVKKAVANRIRKLQMESTLSDAETINAARRAEREKRAEEDNDSNATPQTTIAAPQGPKELRLVIKGDVSGSVEALSAAVQAIGNKDAVVKVVSSSVGEVTESDVMLAKAAEGNTFVASCLLQGFDRFNFRGG